jgi:hypothetical protein
MQRNGLDLITNARQAAITKPVRITAKGADGNG